MTLPPLLIFDLDGTLIDSAGDLHAAANRLLGELGRAPISLGQIRQMVGDGAAALVARVLAASPGAPIELDEAVERFLALYEANATVLTRPFAGVPETLAALAARGHVMAVSTNKPEGPSRRILEGLGLAGFFQLVVGGDTLPWRKPDPRMLIHTAETLGHSPTTAMMIGDSEVDAATALTAGMPFVLMTYGYHRVPLNEIPRLAAFDAFAGLLKL